MEGKQNSMKILELTLKLIDKILNPRATDYPFMYCSRIPRMKIYPRPSISHEAKGKYIVVREFDEGDKHWIWVIRWL